MTFPRQRIAVIGQAQSGFVRRNAEFRAEEQVARVATAALHNAGLEPRDVGLVVLCGSDMLDGRAISNAGLIGASASFLKETTRVADDGAWGVYAALARLWSGLTERALVVAYSKPSEGVRGVSSRLEADPFYLRPIGVQDVTAAALQVRRFCQVFGVTERDAAAVVVKARRNAFKNPNAQDKRELTEEEVLDSPFFASPLRQLDLSPESDGACAVVLGVEGGFDVGERPPVWIQGVAAASEQYYLGGRDLARLDSCRQAGGQAYRMAGVGSPREDLDLAEVFEVTSYGELMLMEALGLCAPGCSAEAATAGETRRTGGFPVNPSGGSLTANPPLVTGLVRIAEVYLQLTGHAGARQVPGATRAVAHATSGMCFQSNVVYVLGVE